MAHRHQGWRWKIQTITPRCLACYIFRFLRRPHIPDLSDDEPSYLGGTPPVHINATNCHTVTINVQIVVESRQHDTIREWADEIKRNQQLTKEATHGV